MPLTVVHTHAVCVLSERNAACCSNDAACLHELQHPLLDSPRGGCCSCNQPLGSYPRTPW